MVVTSSFYNTLLYTLCNFCFNYSCNEHLFIFKELEQGICFSETVQTVSTVLICNLNSISFESRHLSF